MRSLKLSCFRTITGQRTRPQRQHLAGTCRCDGGAPSSTQSPNPAAALPPQAGLHLASSRLTLLAWAQIAKVGKRINAGGVAVIPENLQSIAPQNLRPFRAQRRGEQDQTRGGGFLGRGMGTRASGARALVPQVPVTVRTAVAVGPINPQRIITGIELNLARNDWHFLESSNTGQR